MSEVCWCPNEASIDHQFKIPDGRVLGGTLAWSERAGKWTERHPPLNLTGRYTLKWDEYAQLDAKNGRFRILVVRVTSESTILIVPLNAPVVPRSEVRVPKANGRDDLRRFFRGLDLQNVTLTFEEVEEYLGALPPSASKHKAWWHHVSSHSHAVWELEGYVASPELSDRRVFFRRR